EQSSSTLTITVNDNLSLTAVADNGTTDASFRMTEDDGYRTFNVRANDILDPDPGAPNNVTLGLVSVQPNILGIDTNDLAITVDASNNVKVQLLGIDWQQLAAGQTLDVTIPYTLHGDQPGDVSSTNLTVRVTGTNDAPTAIADDGTTVAAFQMT